MPVTQGNCSRYSLPRHFPPSPLPERGRKCLLSTPRHCANALGTLETRGQEGSVETANGGEAGSKTSAVEARSVCAEHFTYIILLNVLETL